MSSQSHESQVCLRLTTGSITTQDTGELTGGKRGEVGEGEREKRGRKREEGEGEGEGAGEEREESREREEMTSQQAHARAGALATRSKLHGPL